MDFKDVIKVLRKIFDDAIEDESNKYNLTSYDIMKIDRLIYMMEDIVEIFE